MEHRINNEKVYQLRIWNNDVPDYFITKTGKIYSMKSRNKRTNGNPLKWRIGKSGYPKVGIYINGKQITTTMHTLMANTFLGDINDGYEVDHINGDRSNFSLENIEIVTRKENQARRADKQKFHEIIIQNGSEEWYFPSITKALNMIGVSEASPVIAALKRNNGCYITKSGFTVNEYAPLQDLREFVDANGLEEKFREFMVSKYGA